jgi:hypothetical protein
VLPCVGCSNDIVMSSLPVTLRLGTSRVTVGAMMAATHATQRVNGPTLVTHEPMCGPCTSVVAPAAGVGSYMSYPQLMLRCIVLLRSRLGFPGGPCYASPDTWQRRASPGEGSSGRRHSFLW